MNQRNNSSSATEALDKLHGIFSKLLTKLWKFLNKVLGLEYLGSMWIAYILVQ